MALNLVALMCISSIVVLTRSASLQASSDIDVTAYLRRYNYLSTPSGDASNWSELVPSEHEMNTAILTYQKYAGIEVTGVLDEATYRMMQQPRCGVPDIDAPVSPLAKRIKRYTLEGGKWNKNSLTYRISGYNKVSRNMTKGQINNIVKRAFALWTVPSHITFHQINRAADIEITFAHIDGPSNVLGRAYIPSYGGNVKFDTSENWKIGVSKKGEINFLQIATHEFGHSIGIGHSKAGKSVMKPYYRGYIAGFKLEYDDLLAVYYKYRYASVREASFSK